MALKSQVERLQHDIQRQARFWQQLQSIQNDDEAVDVVRRIRMASNTSESMVSNVAAAPMSSNVVTTFPQWLTTARNASNPFQELLHFLAYASEDQAQEALRRLRNSDSPNAILRAIRGGSPNTEHLSEKSTVRAMLPRLQSGVDFELTVRHHMVYPNLSPVKFSLDGDSLRLQLVQSREFSESPGSARGSGNASSPQPYESRPSSLPGMSIRRASPLLGPPQLPSYCDNRLRHLKIDYWTKVSISNEFAAAVLSFTLELEHTFLGFFDADLFITDLIDQRERFCSSFLVNALFYYACVSIPDTSSSVTTDLLFFLAKLYRC